MYRLKGTCLGVYTAGESRKRPRSSAEASKAEREATVSASTGAGCVLIRITASTGCHTRVNGWVKTALKRSPGFLLIVLN